MDEKSHDDGKKFIKENVFKRRTLTGKTVLRVLKTIGLGALFGITALVVMVLLCPAAVKYLSPQSQSGKTVQEAESSTAGQTLSETDVGTDSSGSAGTGVSGLDASDGAAGAASGADANGAGSADAPGSSQDTASGSASGGAGTTTDTSGAASSGDSASGTVAQAGASASGNSSSSGGGSSSSAASSSTSVSSSSGTAGASSEDSHGSDAASLTELSDVWQEISDIGNQADNYIVDVCSIKNATDWFDNHFERKDVYSGIIISADESEVCVLTVSAAVSSADSLRVSLNDGRLFPATLKKSDSLTGLAVISFDPEDEGMMSAEIIEETQGQEAADGTSGETTDKADSASGEATSGSSAASSGRSSASGTSTANADLFPVTGTTSTAASGKTNGDKADSDTEYAPIEAISLDTSGSAQRGDLVIAAGSPRGITHSIAYAWLSYTTDPISISDGTTRLFYADRDIACDRGTWIIDLNGNLIGWLIDDIKEDDTDSQVIMSIADYRDVLETMVKGEDRAYLGVSVVDTDTMHSGSDYPEGVYVKSVAFGGPAYNSGLQPGDYIADIGGHRITSLRSFKYAMNHIQAGSTVTILIYRQSKETYKNIVFEVETGARSSK